MRTIGFDGFKAGRTMSKRRSEIVDPVLKDDTQSGRGSTRGRGGVGSLHCGLQRMADAAFPD
jgi:hypothetical protein